MLHYALNNTVVSLHLRLKVDGCSSADQHTSNINMIISTCCQQRSLIELILMVANTCTQLMEGMLMQYFRFCYQVHNKWYDGSKQYNVVKHKMASSQKQNRNKLTPRAYRLKKRACNCTPIKIQTEVKNSNSVYSEHWRQAS